MKAITVQQPWAWAIIWGRKTVENRKQIWKYRGPLAIHAGLTWSEHGERSGILRQAFRGVHPEYTGKGLPMGRFIGGAILGIVDLVDVHHWSPGCCTSPWAERFPGVTHLTLENPRELDKPIPCRGALGLWTPGADITGQLAAVTHA